MTEAIGACWGGDPTLYTPKFTPLPESSKDLEFAGNIPDEPNVRWSYSVNTPKHIVWSNFCKKTEDGGKLEIKEEAPDGNYVSVWGKPFVNGVRVIAFGANDEIACFDKDKPYNWTYYVISTKIPAFTGVTGVLEVVDGDEPDTSRIEFAGRFDNVFPVFMIAFITRHVVIGRPLAQLAEKEWSTTKDEKYSGPTPPP